MITRHDSLHYQGMMPDIILNIFLAFVIILAVIVFVVLSNSISSSIEMNYTDLGILKANGFDSGRLKTVFLGQYMLAELIGTVAGMILSLPVIKYLPRAFEPFVGSKIFGGVSVWPTAGILAGLLLLSAGFILLISEKVGTISPIRAVSGGRCEVYFDSCLNMPVSGKALSASLAFRQFTSGRRRYIASIVIATLLVFFLMTMTGMADAANSDNAQRAMGAISSELGINFAFDDYSPENTGDIYEKIELIERTIRESSDIEERYFMDQKYMLLNGEKLCCIRSEDEEAFTVTKGRAPKYDNEIIVGQAYAEDMGYEIGNEYEVSYRGESGKFIITGYCVGLTDTGRFFGMSGDAARTLVKDYIPRYVGYKIADPDKTDEIYDRLKTALPETYTIRKSDSSSGTAGELEKKAATAIKAVMYVISAVFALVVVSMVCNKTFIREKTDIGIYKALGFTSQNLRLQFAIRFLIVAICGIIGGTVLSLALSEKLLSFLLRSMGIVKFVIDYRFMTVFLPIAVVAVCYFSFAYMIAGRTKKVEVRSLISE